MCDFCTWVNATLAESKTETKPSNQLKLPVRKDPVVIVHGGAGRIPKKYRTAMLEDVKTAAIQSYTNLIRGSHALDAVEDAISYMESKKHFNCAFNGSLNYKGQVVTDAGIMDSDFRVGSVGAVCDIEHPISLARLVLHNTDHILIAGKGAKNFASESGVTILPKNWLVPKETIHTSAHSESESGDEERETESLSTIESVNERKKNNSEDVVIVVKRFPQCSPRYGEIVEEKYETENELSDIFEPTLLEIGGVGAVAYDRRGRLSSGTSTAGNEGKLVGYMSPAATVPGCGIFADKSGSISVSGHDQTIYSYAPARMFIRRLNEGEEIVEALNAEINRFEDEMGQSNIGAIALDSDGKPGVSFRSQHFPWAYCQLGILYYGCEKNEVLSEKIEGLDRPLNCMCEGVI